jgi:hypothetical protein
MTSPATPCRLLLPLAALLWTSSAFASDFHVIEAEAGADYRGHTTIGLGYTWDVFLTAKQPRGFLLGAHGYALHCDQCAPSLVGGMALASALVTFWKEDLSVITPYIGLAGGAGYRRGTQEVFGQGEVQLALQSRALYDGWWLRPTLFGSYSGAYDEAFAVGLRVAIGYATNHGKRPVEPEEPPQQQCVAGPCEVPEVVEVAASEDSWTLCNCFAPTTTVKVDGVAVQVQSQGNDLVVPVGRAATAKTQVVELELAGGALSVTLQRR